MPTSLLLRLKPLIVQFQQVGQVPCLFLVSHLEHKVLRIWLLAHLRFGLNLICPAVPASWKMLKTWKTFGEVHLNSHETWDPPQTALSVYRLSMREIGDAESQ